VQDGSSVADLASRLAASWSRLKTATLRDPDHDSVDDMHILGSWLSRHDGHPALIPLAPREDADWPAIAARALTLPRASLDFDAWRATRDATEAEWEESTGVNGEVSVPAE
jgi:hypothetical protein